MKLKNISFAIVIFVIFLQNCTAANFWNIYNPTSNTNPTPEYSNFYYLIIRGGYLFHLNHIPGGIGNNVVAKYSGESCSHSILHLVSIGDSTIDAALRNGAFKKIASVSYEQFAILGFAYHRFCTTVTGDE